MSVYRMWWAARVWSAVALTRYGVTASAFYGAAPHKKFQLGSPKGLPSRSFFSEKTEAGAYGLRSSIPPKRSIREFRRFRRLMFHERPQGVDNDRDRMSD